MIDLQRVVFAPFVSIPFGHEYRNWRYTITIFEEERKGRDKKEKKENLNDELIGFSAINQNHLEALFLDPAKIGQGFGKQTNDAVLDT